jgi:bacteriocin propeptide, TIGR03798 family
MELNKELLAKAKNAKTPEELIALANENGMEMTEESAEAYYNLLHPQNGEVSDDELDNVAGGGCHNGGKLVVSVMHYCDEWRCKDDGSQCDIDGILVNCNTCRVAAYCFSCKYCSYEKGLWLCNNPVNMK